ncbi:MAG: hypothetical protein EBY51_09680, partial [Actinobacteria bacterium]|nr:hypothetical protein [Actinomycetota bacterium]
MTIDGDQVTDIRGDAEDVFSRGYICPKGVALGELHADPNRLTQPMIRQADGTLAPSTWDEAFDLIRDRLGPILRDHGPSSVGLFLGNPNVHNLSGAFYLPAFIKALGTTQRFSASTVDQMPKQVACALMYGTALSVPVPDIDRTDYFLILGANPLVSNGSMMTAADFPGRLRELRRRKGRVVVVDPVRTRTAAASDEHLPIRPGTDALWLASLAHLVTQHTRLAAAEPWIDSAQWDQVTSGLADFSPEATAVFTGIDAATTRRIAQELLDAPSAAVYGRMGTTTSGLTNDGEVTPMASLASWLIDIINIAIGSLDRPGAAAFGQLDLLVSVDPYITATSRLADVILPVASPLTRPQHDVVFNNLAVRNQARYSPALLPIPDGEKDETEVVAQLAAIAAGIVSGEEPTAAQIDDLIAYTVAAQAGNDVASRAHGRSPEELLEAVAHRSGVDRILDLRIRSGPYGDGFGAYP